MKLSKLYTNKDSFKTIDFNDGVNIIIGRIDFPKEKISNAHNLGKTIIVRLVDMLHSACPFQSAVPSAA